MEHLESFLAFLKRSKKEIVFMIFCFLFSALLIFPYGDLSDLLTEKVSEQTANQVFLTSEDLGISLFPLGIGLKNVSVDAGVIPELKMAKLSLAPSLASLVLFKPGFVAKADGLFGGDVDLSYKEGEPIGDDNFMHNIQLEISDADLKKLGATAQLPLETRGVANIDLSGVLDTNFGTQPESNFYIVLKNVIIPAGTVPTSMGPWNIPTLEFKSIVLEGMLSNGELEIKQANIGETGNPLQGSINGNISLRFRRLGNQVVPNFGAYNLKVSLKLTQSAEESFGVFLIPVQNFKKRTGSGPSYDFRVKGSSFQTQPQFSL